MNGSASLAIVVAIFVVGTWIRLRPDRRAYSDRRDRSAAAALACATASTAINLVLQFLKSSSWNGAPEVYLRSLETMTFLAILGIAFGSVGRGKLRLAALLWSLMMLGISIFTFGTSGH